jgi:hypothetical protein
VLSHKALRVAVGDHMAASDRIRAYPVLPVAADSLWDNAALERDRIAQRLEDAFLQRGIEAWVVRSKPGEYPPAVSVDSWVQRDEDSRSALLDRGSIAISIQVDPYRVHALTYRVVLRRHARSLDATDWQLSDDEIRECVNGLLDGGRKPTFFRPRLHWFFRLVGLFLPFGPFVRRNRLIDAVRVGRWTMPRALLAVGAGAALTAVAAAPSDDFGLDEAGTNQLVAIAVGVLAFLAAAFIVWRRPVLDSVPKQPPRTPRRELRIDAWHVSVPGAGEGFEAFRQRLLRALGPADPSIHVSNEIHERVGPRGLEARERVVLSKGQATLHVHIYPYAGDAFVGWESHINYLRWGEGDVVASNVRNGCKIKYRTLDVAVHVPNDFDLIDVDVLAETTHRNLVREVKLFLKERELEADLDFSIIRGDRNAATLESGAPKKGALQKEARKKVLRPPVAYA